MKILPESMNIKCSNLALHDVSPSVCCVNL